MENLEVSRVGNEYHASSRTRTLDTLVDYTQLIGTALRLFRPASPSLSMVLKKQACLISAEIKGKPVNTNGEALKDIDD